MIIVLNSLSDRLLICLIKVWGETFALFFRFGTSSSVSSFCLSVCLYVLAIVAASDLKSDLV